MFVTYAEYYVVCAKDRITANYSVNIKKQKEKGNSVNLTRNGGIV